MFCSNPLFKCCSSSILTKEDGHPEKISPIQKLVERVAKNTLESETPAPGRVLGFLIHHFGHEEHSQILTLQDMKEILEQPGGSVMANGEKMLPYDVSGRLPDHSMSGYSPVNS